MVKSKMITENEVKPQAPEGMVAYHPVGSQFSFVHLGKTYLVDIESGILWAEKELESLLKAHGFLRSE